MAPAMISQLCSAPAVWHQYRTKASCLMRSIRAPDREPLRLPCSSWQYPLTCAEPQQVHDILSPPHYRLFLTFSIDSPDPAPILRIASAAAHTPVSLSRPVAAGLARPLILSFSCCCLQEPLCFPLNISSYSLSQLPVLRHIPQSFPQLLSGPAFMLPECQLRGPQHAGVNPGCLNSQQNTLLCGLPFWRKSLLLGAP